MKRSIYSDANSVYISPPIESTLLVDTGGLQNVEPVGTQPSIDISAAVSSGARKFQYNRFFWPKELFSFNYQNGSIGIAVAYWDSNTTYYSFVIYPISLPRIAMSVLSDLQNLPTDNPTIRKQLIRELVYYLNIGFTSYGVGNASRYRIDSAPTTRLPNTGPPIVFATDCKGIITDGAGSSLIVDNPTLPIFSDGATPPPLVWDYTPNQQLLLRINRDFFVDTRKNDQIGFNIVSLRDYMGISPVISYKNQFKNIQIAFPPHSFYIPPSCSSGWCDQGAFSTGMTQRTVYSDGNTVYSDIYDETQRQSLWNDTVFPLYSKKTCGLGLFTLLCGKHQLVMRDRGYVIGKFIASLLPSRYITIQSDAITRNQKRPFVSNSPIINSSTMNAYFITLDNIRSYLDETVSSANSTPSSTGYLKSGIDDSTIVTMDPMQSVQTLDIEMIDEWGIYLQNYQQMIQWNLQQTLPTYPYTNAQFVSLLLEGGASSPNMMTIPAWTATYNPITSGGNIESTLINENWWCNYMTLFYFNPNYSPVSTFIPIGFYPYFPQSTTITHFGRVMGYN